MIKNRNEAHKILGLENNASLEEANKKYRELVKTLRPDLEEKEEIIKEFYKIKEAIEYIRNNDYPIYPVEFKKTAIEKIKRKIKNLNISLFPFHKKYYKLYNNKTKKEKVYSKKRFA